MGVGGGVTAHGIGGPLCFRAHPSTSIAFLAASRFRYRSFALFSNSCYGYASARSEMTPEHRTVASRGDVNISHYHLRDQRKTSSTGGPSRDDSGNPSIRLPPRFGKSSSTGGASKSVVLANVGLRRESFTSNSEDVPVAPEHNRCRSTRSNEISSKGGWTEATERVKQFNRENAQFLDATCRRESTLVNNMKPVEMMQDCDALLNCPQPTSVPKQKMFSILSDAHVSEHSHPNSIPNIEVFSGYFIAKNMDSLGSNKISSPENALVGELDHISNHDDNTNHRVQEPISSGMPVSVTCNLAPKTETAPSGFDVAIYGDKSIHISSTKCTTTEKSRVGSHNATRSRGPSQVTLDKGSDSSEGRQLHGVQGNGGINGITNLRSTVSTIILPKSRTNLQQKLKLPHKKGYESSENQSDFAGTKPEDVLTEETLNGKAVSSCHVTAQEPEGCVSDCRKRLSLLCEKVLVVDNIKVAEKVVEKLTGEYRSHIHACDTEVAQIDVKRQTPVGNGQLICFSIYSGPGTDFGDKKTTIWVDVLDGGGQELLMVFAPFFEDSNIKKVWHNYSFDHHVLKNCGINLSGFYADTMHLARLWDSSRSLDGGYSLEALSSDPKVMRRVGNTKNDPKSGAIKMSGRSSNKHNAVAFATRETEMPSDGSTSEQTIEMNPIGKVSMKTIFGRKKLKKDGSEGKVVILPPVEDLQREDRLPWIGYSSQDSISTYNIFESLKLQLNDRKWVLNGKERGSMYNFYQELWRPFGELLVNMEAEGMLVDKKYLAEIEKVALREQKLVADRFRKWASRHCPDALYMNVGSDTQLRQLFFGGVLNRKDQNLDLPIEREFTVPNIDNGLEEGSSTRKHRKITLKKIGERMQAEIYTANGWPSLSSDGLRTLAGKISTDFCEAINQEDGSNSDIGNTDAFDDQGQILTSEEENEKSVYGSAYEAFGGGKEGSQACHAIAGLCEMSRIDSLISNFILPLQGNDTSGKDGRVHCSLNINTETGRLSSRRPNLQNQPALDKDRYKIREAFIAGPGKSLVVADYGQLELRILAHLSNCKSMIEAFEAGGDFHSRTALNMYSHIREAVDEGKVLLEWTPIPGQDKPPLPLLKDAFAAERRKAKMLNFSIAYGKTPMGLSKDWKVSLKEAIETVDLWYKSRQEVLLWQEKRKEEARTKRLVHTVLGRARHFPSLARASNALKSHIERAAINAPVQGSAADIAMLAMLEISSNSALKEMGWKLIMQIHDEVILEGPTETSQLAKDIVVDCMSKPYYGSNFLRVELAVDAKCALNWYSAK